MQRVAAVAGAGDDHMADTVDGVDPDAAVGDSDPPRAAPVAPSAELLADN